MKEAIEPGEREGARAVRRARDVWYDRGLNINIYVKVGPRHRHSDQCLEVEQCLSRNVGTRRRNGPTRLFNA